MIVIVGTCEVVFDSTAQAFLPMIVDSQQLARANGLLFAAEVVAGSIVGLVDRCLASSTSRRPAVRHQRGQLRGRRGAHPRRSGDGEDPDRASRRRRTMLASASVSRGCARHRLLTTLAWMFRVTNLGLMLGQGIFVKYAVEELGLSNVRIRRAPRRDGDGGRDRRSAGVPRRRPDRARVAPSPRPIWSSAPRSCSSGLLRPPGWSLRPASSSAQRSRCGTSPPSRFANR